MLCMSYIITNFPGWWRVCLSWRMLVEMMLIYQSHTDWLRRKMSEQLALLSRVTVLSASSSSGSKCRQLQKALTAMAVLAVLAMQVWLTLWVAIAVLAHTFELGNVRSAVRRGVFLRHLSDFRTQNSLCTQGHGITSFQCHQMYRHKIWIYRCYEYVLIYYVNEHCDPSNVLPIHKFYFCQVKPATASRGNFCPSAATLDINPRIRSETCIVGA